MMDKCKDNDDSSIWCRMAAYAGETTLVAFKYIIELFDLMEEDDLIHNIVCDVENLINVDRKFLNMVGFIR